VKPREWERKRRPNEKALLPRTFTVNCCRIFHTETIKLVTLRSNTFVPSGFPCPPHKTPPRKNSPHYLTQWSPRRPASLFVRDYTAKTLKNTSAKSTKSQPEWS
jgi:hypothetical protein